MAADRGRLNTALGEIREREPEMKEKADSFMLADVIHSRAKLYRSLMGDAMLTPTALSKHWDALPKEDEARRTQQVNAPAATGLKCVTCNGDKLVLVGTRPAEARPDAPFEEYAPCPECNSHADAGFWRGDGSRFNPPDPSKTRALMRL
jgi:hypothetical protein